MPVELRKRKAPAPPAASPPPRKKTTQAKAPAKVKEPVKEAKNLATKPAKANGAKAGPAAPPAKGDTIVLDAFGGEVETNDGKKTTLKALVNESHSGVVLFTYPKASTPGCTKQACFFRDEYAVLTKTGFLIFGLSADSTKSNTTFQTKQKLTYPLLCDPSRTLISAIGLKKSPNGTVRGVFVVDKTGKVLAAQPGSPQGTVDVVKALVEDAGAQEPVDGKKEDEEKKVENDEGPDADDEEEDEAKKD